MTDICILIAGNDLDTFQSPSQRRCAEQAESIEVRLHQDFRLSDWFPSLIQHKWQIQRWLAAGKVVGVLTNIDELEAEYISLGAVSVPLELTNEFVLMATKKLCAKWIANAALARCREIEHDFSARGT